MQTISTASWHEIARDDGDMVGDKFLGRMVSVVLEPLSVAIEIRGGPVLGSSKATLQEWTLPPATRAQEKGVKERCRGDQ